MKQKLPILFFLLFTFYFSYSQNISGVFSSDFNELTILQSGNKITGTYKYSNGRIEGTLNGRTLTGFWFQDNGKGKMIFEFNSDFTAFTGKWGNNDSEPSGKWNGKRIGAIANPQTTLATEETSIIGVFSSDFNEMTLNQKGSIVTGTYKHRNGRIQGTLNDRTLTGFWFQDNGKGKMIFEFNSDFTQFTGKWGYNDAEPSAKWNGTRIAGAHTASTPQQKTPSKPSTFEPKSTSSNSLLENGLVSWYPFDGDFSDHSPNSYDATNVGASWTKNRFGETDKALLFDGNSSGVRLDKGFPDVFKGNLTVSMWVYFKDDTRAILFGSYNTANNVVFEKHTNNRLRIWWNNGQIDFFSPDNVVGTNKWFFVTFVRDKAQNKFIIYVNDMEVASKYGIGTDVTPAGPFYIGRDSRIGTTVTNGMIDDVKIFNRAITNPITENASTQIVIPVTPSAPLEGSNVNSNNSNSGKINGVYNTDFNEMTLIQNGNNVTGTYKHRNGRIEGKLNDRTLTGLWFQDNGKGKMIFEFNADFNDFIGKWGYNEVEPSEKWNGKKIGYNKTTSQPQSSSSSTMPSSTNQSWSDAAPRTSVNLSVDLSNEDAMVGNLNQHSIQLIMLKGTFDQKVKLEVKENKSAPPFDKKRANLVGTPFEIIIDQKSKWLHQAVQVKLKLEQAEIETLNHPGDLWIGYFNGKKWDYFIPDQVNLKERFVMFETFHFSDYAKAVPTKNERFNDFAHKNALTQYVSKDNNALTKEATEQLVKEILEEQMGLEDKSLAQDVLEAIMAENDYTNLMVNYNDDKMEDFSQNMAILAGKKVCDVVRKNSNSKALLGKITEHSSKIGAGINIGVALTEGDGETAAKALSMEILNTFPLTKLFTKAAEITDKQINRWRDNELEAAYQAYLHGAERNVGLYELEVEAGNFDELWQQLRGLQHKLNDDEIKEYAALKNIHPNDLNSAMKAKIRLETTEYYRQEFSKRKAREAEVEKTKNDNLKLIKILEGATLLERYRLGFGQDMSLDERLGQLFNLKEMILKDTKSRLGFSGVNTTNVISAQTVAYLTQLYYSENGKEKYRQELIKMGKIKEDKIFHEKAVTSSHNSFNNSNTLQGTWKFGYPQIGYFYWTFKSNGEYIFDDKMNNSEPITGLYTVSGNTLRLYGKQYFCEKTEGYYHFVIQEGELEFTKIEDTCLSRHFTLNHVWKR
jgi:hypothetical protein